MVSGEWLVVTGWLGMAERDGRELGTNWHLSGLLFYWPATVGIDFSAQFILNFRDIFFLYVLPVASIAITVFNFSISIKDWSIK